MISGVHEVSTVLPAPAEKAFRLLEDPKSFERLVAGARRIRRFDARWPDPGTAIHHTVGIPPLLLRDSTTVTDVQPPSLLRLEAGIWPLGSLLVEFTFTPHPEGCTLTVREAPLAGPIDLPGLRRLASGGIKLRNLEICRRYRRLITDRDRAKGVQRGA